MTISPASNPPTHSALHGMKSSPSLTASSPLTATRHRLPDVELWNPYRLKQYIDLIHQPNVLWEPLTADRLSRTTQR